MPLQPGHRGQLFNGRRVDVDLPRRPLLTRSVEAQEPEQELPGIRRALAPSSEMPPWRPGFPRAPRIPTATASSLLAPLARRAASFRVAAPRHAIGGERPHAIDIQGSSPRRPATVLRFGAGNRLGGGAG